MDLESNFQHQNTDQLIDSMMTFLDDSTEENQLEEFDELKNPLTWAIKRIINILPFSPIFGKNSNPSDDSFYGNRMHANQIEKVCRFKDPYMLEVNRLMFSSSVGHPPNGSSEYYQAAENYALFGKEFLDFPTDIKFPQPLDVGCFGEVASMPSTSMGKVTQHPQGMGMQMGKNTKQLAAMNALQQQILVNQTNYCSYPFYQAQNLMQPLIYSNPFLMTQYLNTFVKEAQINTSLVQQQQQYLVGGIHERLVYAQMLQQQVQANPTALINSCFMANNLSGTSSGGIAGGGTGGAGASGAKCKLDMAKLGPSHGNDGLCGGTMKTDLGDGSGGGGGGGVDENPSMEQ